MKIFASISMLLMLLTSCIPNKYALRVTNEDSGKSVKFKRGGTIYLKLQSDYKPQIVNQFNTDQMQSFTITQFVLSENPGIMIKKQSGLEQLVLISDIEKIGAMTKSEFWCYKVLGGFLSLTGVGLLANSNVGTTPATAAGISLLAASSPLLLIKRKMYYLNSDSYAEIITLD
jgi:hypothetical protein